MSLKYEPASERSWSAQSSGGRLSGTGCLRRASSERERVLYWQPTGPNPLNHRDDFRDDFSRPALRHGSLNSLFQVALHLPSSTLQVVGAEFGGSTLLLLLDYSPA